MAETDKEKQTLEILRVSATFLIQNQIAVRNNLIPFVVLCMFGYVSSYEGAVFSLDLQRFAPYGIEFTPIAISFALLVIFVRFGFSLFHGIDLVCSNKELIYGAKFDEAEKAVLLQSFKDAYLIDSFLIFLNHPSPIDSKNIRTKRVVSAIINGCLISSLLFSQSIVIIAFANIAISLAWAAATFYIILFSVYLLKMLDVLKNYPKIAERSKPPIYTIKILYFSQPLASLVLSILLIMALSPHSPSNAFVKFKWALLLG